MDDIEKLQREAAAAQEQAAFAALVFARSWAHFRHADAIVLRGCLTMRVTGAKRTSGGVLRA